MKLAIMQPYIFPYIGYWQLINFVDTFVIYDDVNFIKKGYINRNSILSNGKPHVFTLELIGASQNKLIHNIDIGNNAQKIQKTLTHAYTKAPEYNHISPLIQDILENSEKNLARFLGTSIEKISDYLGIETKIIYSSDIEKNCNLNGQEKILDICKRLKTSNYVNAIGGINLYDKERFTKEGIELSFLDSEIVEYKQNEGDFIPYLSIIDVMMFNDKNKVLAMLNSFKLNK